MHRHLLIDGVEHLYIDGADVSASEPDGLAAWSWCDRRPRARRRRS
jgi:hypothetical protein